VDVSDDHCWNGQVYLKEKSVCAQLLSLLQHTEFHYF